MANIKIVCAALAAMIAFLAWPQRDACSAEKDGGNVAYPNKSGIPGPALFSHLTHSARGAGYSCDSCHADASTRKLTLTMNEIIQGKACGACHDGKTKGPRTQQAAFPVQGCAFCHMPATDIVVKLNRMDPVAFSHIRHLGVDSKEKNFSPIGFSCNHCHPEPFERSAKASYGMEVPHETGACVKCHNGQKRKDGLPAAFAANTRCLTCHKSEVSIPSGTQP